MCSFRQITKLLQCTYSKNDMKKMVRAIQQALGENSFVRIDSVALHSVKLSIRLISEKLQQQKKIKE